MLYCDNSSKATLYYRFTGKREITATFNHPIDVSIERATSQSIERKFDFSFDGLRQDVTYSYTISEPSANLESYIYLLDGTWDDYGTIGTYSTGGGLVMRYAGEPLLIGRGNSVAGTVTNIKVVDCYARGTLLFTLDRQQEAIRVRNKALVEVFKDTGLKLLDYRVACGNGCPPGYCKCESKSYPGYCCLPCKEIAAKINNLVQRCNYG